MRINLYVLQKHTVTGETREQFLDVQHRDEIRIGDHFEVEKQTFQVREFSDGEQPYSVRAVCLEVTAPGNPELIP